MHALNAHVSVGLSRGFVLPSAIRIARGGRRRVTARSHSLSAATGIIGGMVVGASLWSMILYLAI